MIGFAKRAGSVTSVDRRPMRTLILSGVCLTIVAVCLAHEGHQPLPTRGVQVDIAKGTITLSDSSRRLMDVQTVTVDQGQLVQKLPAFASVVVPWDRRAVVTTRVAGRVVQLLARPGDRVLKGQAIAEIRSPELDQLRESIDTARNTARSAREIIEGLKAFEFTLYRRLGLVDQKSPTLGTRAPVPSEYRAAVEEYYRSLAGSKRKP